MLLVVESNPGDFVGTAVSGTPFGKACAAVGQSSLMSTYDDLFSQKLWLAGFSRGIQEVHRRASLVLRDAVRNINSI
ncbi:ABC transporter B family member 20-like [Vicia villosa]|uniref:ABC transporter B family member 20-like n=1 Tax=Vicia villosa TaxID=3911 RepID=UPI00273C1CBD|nr:ABC transporter B family member 20-like [Vicia villosa]